MEQFILILKYLLLGIIQGVTEPIPVSSSGHLIIAQQLMGMEHRGLAFEVFLNTASLIAILFIYREMLLKLAVNGCKFMTTRKREYKSDFMFIVYIVVGTIPAGILGVLFKDQIESVFSSAKMVGLTLLITGAALWLIRNLRGVKREGDLKLKDAILVGLAQAVALIPGISRSGATVIASIAVGMKQETALRFSFMLYIPISLGGLLVGASDIASDPEMSTLWLPYAIAFIATLILTYLSMKWLMNIMAKGNLGYFAYYCFAAGILLLVLL
ncbi:UDP pyrophosphate phosphatase [Paenibacillus oryzae]|uniref:Undecaprenyl-diphosphatase n=1 Tax=Paenibacillus oryzae TaxID=1844972 RepID=A0A1A5YKY3_9BACL|nr:undecaprenyl-diphosphate phosphatase [Paenibacillus oryzae]OBR66271.1 UDP pyrophosphate phosphatase [Paenibacillus oryzae]